MDDSHTPAKSVVNVSTPMLAQSEDIIAGGLDDTLNFAEQELARVDSLPEGTPERAAAVQDAEKALQHAARMINLRAKVEARKQELQRKREVKENLNLSSTPQSSFSVNIPSDESPAPWRPRFDSNVPPTPTPMKPRQRVDPALVGKSLSEHSSDAVSGDSISSADLSAAGASEEAKAYAAGVDNAMSSGSEEMTPDEIDSSVQKIINDVSESTPSASKSESSKEFSEEQSKSIMLGSDTSASSEHESIDLAGGLKQGKVVKKNGKYYKTLENAAEREDMQRFYESHRGKDLTPAMVALKYPKDKPNGVFVTHALEDGYIPVRKYVDTKQDKTPVQKKEFRLALFNAFKKINGKWNDLVNADNIMVKPNPDGTFDIRFIEGGRYDGGLPGTPDNRAMQYAREFYYRERKTLIDRGLDRTFFNQIHS